MTTIEREPAVRTEPVDGFVTGRPRMILRAEGSVLLAAALVGFATTGEPWWLVPLLLFAPDVLMAGYLRSTRLGALTYNLAHSYPAPALLGGIALAVHSKAAVAVALVWFAHIGMDRLLGYGLKHDDGFTHTHLGIIGHRAPSTR